MLLKVVRKASSASADSNENRKNGCLLTTKGPPAFKAKVLIRREPIMKGLSAGLAKKFQRPMVKRRAYGSAADHALKTSSLGQKRRMDGMQKLLARAGKGLHAPVHKKPISATGEDNEEEEEEDDAPEERPFEPLRVWHSPHQGGEPKGLPPRLVQTVRPDEYGVEEEVTLLQPVPVELYAKADVFVPPVLAKWLRPHQREGVSFMYECVMGLRDFPGNGCILADDMGLGKTLQSVALIYTLLKTGITAKDGPTAKRVIIVCPCSLVKNWDHEFIKWLGPGVVKCTVLAEANREKVERDIKSFVTTKITNVLIASYECIRTHAARFSSIKDSCDLLVCGEAHRLKNSDNQTSRALNSLPVKRRVLLTGTPMQNDLQEFYAMVDFTNPGILGTPEEFRRKMLFPILRGREPDATDAQRRKMMEIQNDMSSTVNDFILRRINTLNAEHLPPKLVQVVCCNLTEIQQNMYQHLVNSKDMHHVLEGKQVNCLGSIQMLMKLCNHPSLVAEEDKSTSIVNSNKRSTKVVKYNDEEKETSAAPGADGIAKFLPYVQGGGRRGDFAPVHPEWSGKMFVLCRLMREMRKPGNGNDKIVIISNYTQTLDLIGRMCRENNWGFCRLDGSISMKKRQNMVDSFNDPSSSLVAFLLSSKAGGCGLNLIGGNRLVLFDPDWNPAVDKQAAARCWRDGQKKRCFTYRFLATGTVEEKIFQRQLSKEGLQSIVDDKEQVNELSTKDLRNLFKFRSGTPSDTHDKLRCERCEIIHDNAEMEARKVLPKKLTICKELLEEMRNHPDASHFLKPLDVAAHGRTKEEYEKLVKQPMDIQAIQKKLDLPADQAAAYRDVSGFSKDVNRIFSNVLKVWSPGDDIADVARQLQGWWIERWTETVPRLMSLKAEDDSASAIVPCEDALATCATINNERGEDYQEQIGMPDDENMRHWSHHYATDTVDDPVFRAAMRGFDAVSFVFGLEVTWSLIQQRQHEEEERAAMQELENMDTSDANCAKEDRKPAAENTDGRAECLEHSTADEEGVAEMEEGGTVAIGEPAEEHSSEEEESDTEMQEDKSVAAEEQTECVNTDGLEEECAADMEDDESSAADEEAVALEAIPSEEEDPDPHVSHAVDDTDCLPAEDRERVSAASPLVSEQTTPSCEAMVVDLPSESSAVEAQVCSSVKGSKELSQGSTESSTGAQELEPLSQESLPSSNEWACWTCTLHNKKTAKKCQICGAKKPR